MSAQDMPTVNVLPNLGILRRHGSAEQVNRGEGGTYLTSINTPRKLLEAHRVLDLRTA